MSKYAWVQLLKSKKAKTVVNGFMKKVNESYRKPKKLWLDQWREFCNQIIQESLNNNDVLMYLTHKEGNLVIAEKFIKTLKIKTYKQMTANDSKSYFG